MLVSVIVITYNSALFVLETLNSIANQDYKDIELIISDDCSTDNTIEICSNWLKFNSYLFVKAQIVQTIKNGGICVNYNNGLKYAHGEYVKFIAGDDWLTYDCITSFVKCALNCDEKIFICGTLPFTKTKQLTKRLLPSAYFEGDAKSQERLILRKGTIIEGPTLFLETKTLRSLGGFEEKYPFIEDYPLYMKYLAAGYRIKLLERYLVHYREYPESVSRSNKRFADSIYRAIDDYAIPAAKRQKAYILYWHYYTQKIIRDLYIKGGIKLWHKMIGYFLSSTDIILWKQKIKKIACKSFK